MSHRDAVAKIFDDHQDLPGFSIRNISRNLPLNSPTVPRRVRTRRHKRSTTNSNIVPELSNTKLVSPNEQYSESCEVVMIDADGKEHPYYDEPIMKKHGSDVTNTGSNNENAGPQYQIPREMFETLTIALEESRTVCYVYFDDNRNLLKAIADTDYGHNQNG